MRAVRWVTCCLVALSPSLCVSASGTCATLEGAWNFPPVLQLASYSSNPADGFDSCPYVWSTGPEFQSLVSASSQAACTSDSSEIASLQNRIAQLQSALDTQSANVTAMQSGMQSLLNAAAANFDPVFAFAGFSFFYCAVILFWSIGKGIGLVLSPIKPSRR